MQILINKKYFKFEFFFLLLLLQQVLLRYSTGIVNHIISYTDEILALVLLLEMILNYRVVQAKLSKIEAKMLLVYIAFAALGLISSATNPVQSAFLIFSDMLVCMKVVIFYFYTRTVLNVRIDSTVLIGKLSRMVKPLVLLFGLLAIHDIAFTPFFKKADYRYFMYALQLCFGHPTLLAAFSITCAVIIMAGLSIKNKKNDKCVIWAALTLAILTLRGKAIAATIAIVVMYVTLFVIKKYAKVIGILGGVVAALMAGWDQFAFYFGAAAQARDDFIRAKLLRDSISLANQFFPIGTGYGSFGSNIAAEHYSPLYVAMGYSGLAGGSREENFALSDSFWPIIIAQFGWIGLLLFVYFLIGLVRKVFELYGINRYLFWAGISAIVYEIIASIAESAFFHPVAIPLFCVLGLIINSGEIEYEKHIKDNQ